MIDKLLAFVEQEALFGPEDTVLLAVSGGIDSVVMLHLFSQVPSRFAVAHCNFGLRGEESDGDQALVALLAQQYGVAFHHQTFDTQKYATQHQISIQMAARTLRYRWFKQLVRDHDFSRVATAHHREDQLETALFNFTKGTGVAGLRGMLARQGHTIRPMLWATKAEITAYAREHALRWREDQSNASDYYQRNLIRHQVVPSLLTINPNLWNTFATTAERLRATEQLLQEAVRQFVQVAVTHHAADQVHIALAALRAHPQSSLLLSEVLRPYGFSYGQSRAIAAQLNPPTVGKIFTADKWALLIDRQVLMLKVKSKELAVEAHIEASDTYLSWKQCSFTVQCYDRAAYVIRPDAHTAALDEEKLTFPLTLRRWQTGDTFCPLGMAHHKKVSDFLIDAKVSRFDKEQVSVLISDQKIVWVVGYRIDHRYRVTPETKRVYELVVK